MADVRPPVREGSLCGMGPVLCVGTTHLLFSLGMAPFIPTLSPLHPGLPGRLTGVCYYVFAPSLQVSPGRVQSLPLFLLPLLPPGKERGAHGQGAHPLLRRTAIASDVPRLSQDNRALSVPNRAPWETGTGDKLCSLREVGVPPEVCPSRPLLEGFRLPPAPQAF